MFFFTPSHVRQGQQYIKDARKLVAYKRDLAPEEAVEAANREIAHLEHAVDSKDKTRIHEQMQRLDQVCGKLTRPVEDAAWRENVEVFLVAIVIALAVRTYFLQPFTIPTGSMQPTLNGIITKTEIPPPNVVSQALQKVLFFRTYYHAVALEDETLVECEEVNRFRFFTYTRLATDKGNTYLLHAPARTLIDHFNIPVGRRLRKGETILEGYSDTGDHVFVDKLTYHFRRPRRDQVFVFSTHDIPKLNEEGKPSQFYIKRLAGLPNDTLRIDPPHLYINGNIPDYPGMKRVMTGVESSPPDGYRGYGHLTGRYDVNLSSPSATFQVEPDRYLALGDNSYNSLDSRYWGTVPKENIAGRAIFVYYPFSSHFGWIW